MRRPEWTEILAVIGLTVALGLLAPGPRPRTPVSAIAPPAAVSDPVARDGTAPLVTVPVTSPR